MKSWINAAILASVILGAYLFYYSPQKASAEWYSTGGTWTNRKAITIDHTKVEGSVDLTNFPVLIDITDSSLATYAQADGDDILFTSSDGTTKLDHEIELYTSATGRLTAWVEIPTLDFDDNTVIYMYYGNSGASSQQNMTGTWNSGFQGVYHLKETPDGSSGQIKDSTASPRDGTTSNMDSSNQVAGPIDGSFDFAAGDLVAIGDAVKHRITNNFTTSFWFKAANLTQGGSYTFYKGNDYAHIWEYTNNQIEFFASGYTGTNPRTGSGITISDTNWHHIAYAYNGTRWAKYLDGVETEISSSITFSLAVTANTMNAGGFLGGLDELRVSNTARSADWIKTEYNNQSATSTFYTIEGGSGVPMNSFVNVGGGTKIKGGVKFK